MTDDGKTAGGCWIYTGVTVEGRTASSSTRRPAASPPTRRTTSRTAGASRGRPTGGSSTTAPPPTSRASPGARRRSSSGGIAEAPGNEARQRRASGSGLDVPDFNAFLAPDAKNGDKPFIMRADLVGAFFGPLNDGPFPEHYEPVESPTKNLLSKQQINPVAKIWKRARTRRTTWRRWARRTIPTSSRRTGSPSTTSRASCRATCRCWPSCTTPTSPRSATSWPRELGIDNGERITVLEPARQGARDRDGHATASSRSMIDGKKVHQIGVPWHWG